MKSKIGYIPRDKLPKKSVIEMTDLMSQSETSNAQSPVPKDRTLKKVSVKSVTYAVLKFLIGRQVNVLMLSVDMVALVWSFLRLRLLVLLAGESVLRELTD